MADWFGASTLVSGPRPSSGRAAVIEVGGQRWSVWAQVPESGVSAIPWLERQALTDPLTGIANRRAFTEHLSDEVSRAQRYGRQLSLAIIDLDRFKAVNDLHGHQAGDRVLAEFAQLLGAHSRDGDLVARIGGEEFAWLMPETDQQDAYIAASRVREAIERTSIADVGTVTISAGVCSTEHVHDAETLVRNADRALYWAKDGGRNMTFIYTDAAHAAFGDGCRVAVCEGRL